MHYLDGRGERRVGTAARSFARDEHDKPAGSPSPRAFHLLIRDRTIHARKCYPSWAPRAYYTVPLLTLSVTPAVADVRRVQPRRIIAQLFRFCRHSPFPDFPRCTVTPG